MTETAPKPRQKYTPPDGKPAYRVVVEVGSSMEFEDPGFESTDEALKWAKENVSGAGVRIHVVRMVLTRKSVEVPAKTRWS